MHACPAQRSRLRHSAGRLAPSHFVPLQGGARAADCAGSRLIAWPAAAQQTLGQAYLTEYQFKSNRVWTWLSMAYVRPSPWSWDLRCALLPQAHRALSGRTWLGLGAGLLPDGQTG